MRKPYPPEVRQQALELHEQGMAHKQISLQLGIPHATVFRWLNPDYAEKSRIKSRELKQKKYRGTCIDCGASTSYRGKSGRRSARRCVTCQTAHQRQTKTWTRERVVAAIRYWAETHDGVPPKSTDWKYRRGGMFPSCGSVYGPSGPFEKWGDAIEAAGFPRLMRASNGPKRLWSIEEAIRLREQGLGNEAIGKRFGVSGSAIYNALGRQTPVQPRPVINRQRTRDDRINDLRSALAQQSG